MLNTSLIKKEVQEYISNHLHTDLSSLRLKKSPFPEISSLELVQQIQGKKIARYKLPFLYNTPEIIYPPHLNLEQASSEATATFKQGIIQGKTGADLTGGTGIDSFFLSENTEAYYFIEPNADLLEIVQHNFEQLNRTNINFINETAEYFLESNTPPLDFIYLDPSRRDSLKNKKFLLEDLLPDVTKIQKTLVKFSSAVFIKLSPLLDIQQTIEKLTINHLYVLSVKNDVKELLIQLDCEKFNCEQNKNPEIHCINLESGNAEFSFYWMDEKKADIPEYSSVKKYLYIPNSSILKSGAFKLIAQWFELEKLHPNTHIYTHNEIKDNFPGRIFKVIQTEYPPKNAKGKKFNLINKNYPVHIEEIKKRYKITEGGTEYLFFMKDTVKNTCVLAELI